MYRESQIGRSGADNTLYWRILAGEIKHNRATTWGEPAKLEEVVRPFMDNGIPPKIVDMARLTTTTFVRAGLRPTDKDSAALYISVEPNKPRRISEALTTIVIDKNPAFASAIIGITTVVGQLLLYTSLSQSGQIIHTGQGVENAEESVPNPSFINPIGDNDLVRGRLVTKGMIDQTNARLLAGYLMTPGFRPSITFQKGEDQIKISLTDPYSGQSYGNSEVY